MANTNDKVILKILFLTLSKVKVNFAQKKFI